MRQTLNNWRQWRKNQRQQQQQQQGELKQQRTMSNLNRKKFAEEEKTYNKLRIRIKTIRSETKKKKRQE